MNAVVETKENELTVGTVVRVPDEFTYQIFIMGLRNLQEDQTDLMSILRYNHALREEVLMLNKVL